MNPLVARFMANKHTNLAAAVCAGAYALEHIGPRWFPGHAAAFVGTASDLRNLAIMYGMMMAGDGKKPDGNGNGNGNGSTATGPNPPANPVAASTGTKIMRTITACLVVVGLFAR